VHGVGQSDGSLWQSGGGQSDGSLLQSGGVVGATAADSEPAVVSLISELSPGITEATKAVTASRVP
jgi:hypothetical protein